MERFLSTLVRYSLVAFILLPSLFSGCFGDGKPSGCPKDLAIPDQMQVLGASYESTLFVLRLRTDELQMNEVVPLFRDSMKSNGWTIKLDSATDENGGEIQFRKGENRSCTIFMSHASKQQGENKMVNIDIKCDRDSVR